MSRADKGHYDRASYTNQMSALVAGACTSTVSCANYRLAMHIPWPPHVRLDLAHIPGSPIDVHLCVNDNISIVDLSPSLETNTKFALITESYSLLSPSSDPPSNGRAGKTNLPDVFVSFKLFLPTPPVAIHPCSYTLPYIPQLTLS